MAKLTFTQKLVLPKDTQELLKAGFLTPELKITDDLRYFIEYLALEANMPAVLKRAKEKNAEAEADCKEAKKAS